MTDAGLPLVLTAIALFMVALFCIVRKKKPSRSLLLLAFTAYLGMVVAITLFPIPMEASLLYNGSAGMSRVLSDDIPYNFSVIRYNIVPFATILAEIENAKWSGYDWILMRNLIGNVLMFIPLGFLLPALSQRMENLFSTIVTVFCCSVLIEAAQLMIGIWIGNPYRAADVDDLILNTLGGILGYLVFLLWDKARRSFVKRQDKQKLL